MSVNPNARRLMQFFPLAQAETLATLFVSPLALEIYLAEMHELTVSEVRETFVIAGLTWDVGHAEAA